MSHYNDDDDLFGDEKLRTTSSSSVPRTHSTVVDDEDYFYEKLGGSLYGGLSSAMLPPGGLNVRFADVPLSSFQEYPENDYDIEYPPTAYNRYSKISDMDHEGSQMGVLIMGGPSIMGGRLDGSALMGPPVDGGMTSTLHTDNYNVNLLEEAEDTMDPFGEDDSLFSDTGEEPMRRATTLRRRPVQQDDEDDDFTPRLNYTKTLKRAKLVHGNYIIDAPVPNALLNAYTRPQFGDSNETSFVRYSGVTCGPSNFIKFNYSLRQTMYSPPRATEILVCITMYNEDDVLLGRTLKGVFDNIKNLTNRTDPAWGEGSWKKVTVVIVNDGRLQLHERTQKLLTALGIFQEGYAKSKVNDNAVKAHLYEYTTTVGIERVTKDRVSLTVGLTPAQLIFCLKEKNARKINSHRWCFQAIAPLLDPKVIMLLDCGTKPAKDAFYHLWNSFKDPNVAGACGEMRVALGPGKQLLLNPLVAAQNFEYKISNVLDKPMESVFGFISVLPGAFSAYRWHALLNVDGKGPLEKYFKGEFLHQNAELDKEDDEYELKEKNFEESGIFTSNMYLAEDRILCFELVAKRDKNYVLRYVSSATAETDVPERIDDFVLQRRRWLNGSLFAAMYSIFHWTAIWRSNHSLLRKLWLQVEFYYQTVTVLVSWFSLSSFFLVFRILTRNLGSSEVGFTLGKYLSAAFLWVYVGCVICTFVLAFGNTPRGTRKFYFSITVIYAILMVYLTFAAVYLAVNTVKLVLKSSNGHFTASMLLTNEKFRDLVVSMLSTYLLYAMGAIIHGEPSFMVTSFAQYLLLSPSYINVLNIYSFCNIHDVSWGNRDVPQARDLGTAKVSDENGQLVMTVVPGSDEELEEAYLNTLEELKIPALPELKIKKKKLEDDSYYAFIRTVTVLSWMFTNAILVGIVLATGGSRNNTWNDYRNSTIFLTVILWVVCALAACRLIGSVLYVLQRMIRPIKWKIQSRKSV